MIYAAAETRISSSELVVNLSNREIYYGGIAIEQARSEFRSLLESNLKEDNKRFTLLEPATSMLMKFCDRPFVKYVFVNRDVFHAVNTLRKSNYVFRKNLDQVVCDDFRDSFGNYI